MNKKQSGMGTRYRLGVLVAVLIIGGAGWAVYQMRQQPAAEPAPLAAQTPVKTNIDPATEQVPADILRPFTIPASWQQRECGSRGIAVVAPGMDAPSCGESKIYAPILVSVSENYTEIDPQHCGRTAAKQPRGYAGFVSYDCTDITLDGKRGIREVFVENQGQTKASESTYIRYAFPVGDQLLTVAYLRWLPEQGDMTDTFEGFVQTLKFR